MEFFEKGRVARSEVRPRVPGTQLPASDRHTIYAEFVGYLLLRDAHLVTDCAGHRWRGKPPGLFDVFT